MVMTAQSYECTYCYWILYVKMVKMVDFISYILPNKKKRERKLYLPQIGELTAHVSGLDA